MIWQNDAGRMIRGGRNAPNSIAHSSSSHHSAPYRSAINRVSFVLHPWLIEIESIQPQPTQRRIRVG